MKQWHFLLQRTFPSGWKPGFKHLMQKTDPRYKLPSRVYFSDSEIPQMFEKVCAAVQKNVSEGTLWTSRTLHLFNHPIHRPGLEANVPLLGNNVFPGRPHPRPHFQYSVFSRLGKYQKRRLSFTTDNASNMRKAFEDDQHPWVWFGRFGNNLNLAISKKNIYIVSYRIVLKMSYRYIPKRRCLHPAKGYELPARSYEERRWLHPATSYRLGATTSGGAFILQPACLTFCSKLQVYVDTPWSSFRLQRGPQVRKCNWYASGSWWIECYCFNHKK